MGVRSAVRFSCSSCIVMVKWECELFDATESIGTLGSDVQGSLGVFLDFGMLGVWCQDLSLQARVGDTFVVTFEVSTLSVSWKKKGF